MDYDALVAQLFERHRSVQTAGFSGDAYKPGLEAMEAYAAFLGHPERRFRSIHVAGTNGKGSVCSMLAAALAGLPAGSAGRGLRAGLYTSPHLLDFRERMKIIESPASTGFREIPREAVQEFLENYDREGLTFFEVTTGMAFRWFADEQVDVAVIETGLGGRLDSTNIITPELSVITSIGLDHCALLGNTRAEIAAEKAGIFKPGVPALVWGRDPETQPVFEASAERIGAPLYFAEDFEIPEMPELDLSGPCQDLNFRTVCAALEILSTCRQTQSADNQRLPSIACPQNTAGISRKWLTDNVLTLLSNAGRITGFMGRWQILRQQPLTICDIGHNPPALKENFARLASLRKPLLVVYGVMADKDVDSISHLLPADAKYFLVAPDTPRAMSAQDLALKLKNLDCTVSGTVAQGVRDAMEQARADSIVYIGGSTYVVSEALKCFEGL